jgi:hypothetical protein
MHTGWLPSGRGDLELPYERAYIGLLHMHATSEDTLTPELELHDCHARPAATNAAMATHVRQLWCAGIAQQTPARSETNKQLKNPEQQRRWSS